MTNTETIRARVKELSTGEKRERAGRILTLLEHYQDVLRGLQDGRLLTNERVLALMCQSWNSPAFRQLERLRIELADISPEAYRQLSAVYFTADFKRVAFCPKCGETKTPHAETILNGEGWPEKTLYGWCRVKHDGRTTAMSVRIERVTQFRVDFTLVAMGVLWLEKSWQGGVFIPEELLAIEGRRHPKRTRVAA